VWPRDPSGVSFSLENGHETNKLDDCVSAFVLRSDDRHTKQKR
jgi:hypothetical protein